MRRSMVPQFDSFDDENDSIGTEQYFQAVPLSLEENQQGPASPSSSRLVMDFEMPPQLHPACSAGVKRVSSCYFSLASANDNQSISEFLSLAGETNYDSPSNIKDATKIEGNENEDIHDSAGFFYHDILMQVFTFLDPNSLLSFSETARRSNFEVFYFLQLQLQQALLLEEESKDSEASGEISGPPERAENYSASIVSRVARLDMGKAREIVEEYQDSNSTLRTMPLSYSLAYVRHYLLRNGIHKMFSSDCDANNDSNNNTSSAGTQSPNFASSQTLASAAIFVTFMGAASIVSTSEAPMAMMTDLGSELPNVLFRVGFVGSLMRAISETERGTAMKERAEKMARSMQELPAALMPARRMQKLIAQTQDGDHTSSEAIESNNIDNEQSQAQPQRMNFVLPSLYEMRHMLQHMMSNNIAAGSDERRQSLLFDPYGHLPPQKVEDKTKSQDDREDPTMIQSTDNADINTIRTADRKMPSGCVGAYSRSIHKATEYVTSQTRTKRKSMFESLSSEEQRLRSLEFLRVCSSNDTIDRVKDMISVMDVNRFYVGTDGNETCALHTAAFHGADKVVEFLCAGIDLQDSRLDGGLCDVNAKDDNGWTALHFATGANSIAAVRVLARYGALLNEEAHNGYTPLTWANRLSHIGIADELRERMSMVGTDQGGTWIYSKPLASIANHFFSLIPSQ